MFTLKNNLCSFINTATTFTDCVNVYTYAILACKKWQRTQRASKQAFIYTKKRATRFSSFQALNSNRDHNQNL